MPEIRSNVICRECGTPIPHPTRYQKLCDECQQKAIHKDKKVERICIECGRQFIGGPSAKRCPDCKRERDRERARLHQQAKAAGHVRELGRTYICEACGKPYVLNSGMQKYCPDCMEEQRKKDTRAKVNEYMRANKGKYPQYPRMRVCVICGKILEPGTRGITCSPECAEKRALQQYDASKGNPDPDYYPTMGAGHPQKSRRQMTKPSASGATDQLVQPHKAVCCKLPTDEARSFADAALVNGMSISQLLQQLVHDYMADKDIAALAAAAEKLPKHAHRDVKKTCKKCGIEFMGDRNAKYCPACKIAVQRQQTLDYSRRMRPKTSRHVGEVYPCKRCGNDYVLETPSQQYCRKCAKIAYREYAANAYQNKRARKAQKKEATPEQAPQKTDQ